MSGKLTISTEAVTSASTVWTLRGDMTAADAAVVEAECERFMAEGKAGVVVDLSEVGVVTSAGLGAVADMARVLRSRNGRVVVAAGGESEAAKLITMLGLKEWLSLVETAAEGKRMVVTLK